MVLTKDELIEALKKEVHILLHLTGKIEPRMLDYRPTPKQRSTLELLRYLSFMGPTLTRYALSDDSDAGIWGPAAAAAESRDFEQTLVAIAGQKDEYERLLRNVPEPAFRVPVMGFDGNRVSRGALLVSLALNGCAAYRTQLFNYLKACGRVELGTMNLWSGIDAPLPA